MLSLTLLLATHCPPALVKRPDGRCYYRSPYVSSSETSGLRKRLRVKKNGLSPKVIDLGRHLFFERALSGDGTISCASCHDPKKSLADGLARGFGVNHKKLNRSSPPLWNVAFFESFFWDARAKTLEEQMEGPLFSPDEMGASKAHIERVLNNDSFYIDAFREAFPSLGRTGISLELAIIAIADFQRSLVSLNSRFDQFVFGKRSALSHQEFRGWNVFRSFVTRCTECHEPPLFTNFQMARIGAPESEGLSRDPGQMAITNEPRDLGVFRIPSIRNIVQTAPYMHSGAFPSLSKLVEFYNDGGGRHLQGLNSPKVHWHIVRMGLSAREKKNLLAFFNSLTDESAVPAIPMRGKRENSISH